jgi:REP element-mobilizing transposase RayT
LALNAALRLERFMSRPRQLLPESTYLITRATTQRKLLLRPDAVVERVVLYCLFYAARKYGISVHAFCVLSTHVHLVVTDHEAQLPRFMHWFSEFTAKCLNRHHGQRECFWEANSKYNAVRLEAREDVLDKIVYTMTNPVHSRLEASSSAWLGAKSLPRDVRDARGRRQSKRGKAMPTPFRAKRPEFFSPDGELPAEVTGAITKPAAFADLNLGEYEALLARCVREREKTLRAEIIAEHGARNAFLGAKKALKADPHSTPATPRETSAIVPTIAAKDRETRIAALERRRAFLAAYDDALDRYRRGERTVKFPPGTYRMRVLLRVRCARA